MLLILFLVMLVTCLPAQADRGGQSGGASGGNDHDVQASVSSAASSADAPVSAAITPETNAGGGVSSQSPVQAGPDVMTSETVRDQPSADSKSTHTVNVNAQSRTAPSSGPSADPFGRPDISNNGRVDVPGDAGSRQDNGGADTKRIPKAAGGAKSPQRAGGKDAVGVPDVQGQSGESGRMAGLTGSSGGIAVARFASFSESGAAPGPGAGHGPSPQRQQRGPPAQSTSYPCGPAQATPLPPASCQTRDESKEESLSRQRSKRVGILSQVLEPIGPEPASSSLPPQALFPFNMLLLGGFRRISKKNVLDHDARQVIYQAVTTTPGIDVKTLTRMTGINENTLRYHLDRLVATGKISSFTRPGVIRYFLNQGAYRQFEHRVFHYLWADTPRGILSLLHQNPGLTRQHIADALMIAGPSVTRQMDNLIEDGIVENRFPGRSNHYYLTAEAAVAIDRVMSHAHGLNKKAEALPMAASTG